MIEAYILHILTLIGIYGILSISLNFLLGYGGILNLGHMAFFGIGAYTSALFSLTGLPLIFDIIIGGLFAAVSGYLLSLISKTLKKDYLCLATLAFNFVVYSLFLNFDFLTNGAQGITGIPTFPNVYFSFILTSSLLLLTLIVTQKLTSSTFGKTMQAMRDNELFTQTLGNNTFTIKNNAMAYSAFIAGVAGALYAHYIGFINPSTFGLGEMILLLTIVILGGLTSLKGTIIATFFLISLPELLRFITLPSSIVGPIQAIAYACILLVLLTFKPRGLLGKIDFT